MNYEDYKNARDAAWKILIDCQVVELPVRISTMCQQLGIPVRRHELQDSAGDGMSILVNGTPLILVRASNSPQRQRFTAAHELGHILLGHVGKYELINREPDPGDNPIEQAANVFASRLLAPACVLWGCGAKTPEHIMELCGISRQAAEFRAARMELLYQRQKFLASPLEKQVYTQFLPYIHKHRL